MNETVTAISSQNGVNFLSMSAGSELEPGPSWSGQQSGQKLALRPGVLMMSREAQATARAVGWGGSTGGELEVHFCEALARRRGFYVRGVFVASASSEGK